LNRGKESFPRPNLDQGLLVIPPAGMARLASWLDRHELLLAQNAETTRQEMETTRQVQELERDAAFIATSNGA
jgi:hypothetical protein